MKFYDIYTNPIKCPKLKRHCTVLTRMWDNLNSHSLLRRDKAAATLEKSLGIYNNVEHVFPL